METKEICQKLNQFVDEINVGGKHRVNLSLFSEAADRLEELEEISENWCNLNDENMELLRKYREDITELKQQLAAQQPEWISVKDRLPEENGTFIIAIKDSFCPHFTGFDAESNEFCGNVFRKKDITHWMPLPEPPKPKDPTFKEVFLEAFPKAAIYKNGTPKSCIEGIFPWGKHHDCDGIRCNRCWNQSYFEEEGEADA